jgi:class 3 adenylate cyclase/tetratricopeptide (TPR) repeat protein
MAGGTPRRERKVVTVVFCDLVGFTSKAESMDPEDVEALLRPYHERVRRELERHGGTVEKFIGDAVMALFGAPTAHEDDPERAVRAALAIREFALDEELELRVGITTGEALVRLDVQPEAGEGMASGDVVNTAARLQSAAPVNGILVDETTYRATRAVIDHEPAEAVVAKGKAEPIAAWTATAAHSRFGVDTAHEARSVLVGRERELGIVRDVFERARHEQTPQLLTLVGVPGIGKSRLVYELFTQVIVPDPDLITWRQGRCLAYGDGITLWALGEIVKAQAGVVEQDSQEEIAAKVHQSVEDTLAGTGDEAWVEAHLLALLGLAEETQLGGDRRNEAFAAWRRFLEGLAEQRPFVVVVEDIHWADETLLDFLDELVDWVTDVPLLVVATARPELLERRPGWGGGKLNATTLALSPLSDDQTAVLLGQLLGKPVLEAESQHALLERAGGNPLYAEQFAELYVEQGSTDELGLPETLQGIIAARLDGLPESEKSLIQDAAVVGKVFWASSIGRDPEAATASLHALERKGFVRRQRRSSLEGESEFAFAHALVRDVSYGQIPRTDRARRHRAVAEWIDGLGRPEDHAEMLAYHWSSALELARAAGGDDDELTERTRMALRDAGDRAFALNSFRVAAAQYEEALALWPDDRDRPELMFRYARALFLAYDEERRQPALEAARDALTEAGDSDRAAETESLLAQVSWYRGEDDATRNHLSRAEALAGDSVSASAARVLAVSARMRVIAEELQDGRRLAASALAMAEELGLDELRAHALTTTGMVKNAFGDPSGTGDIEYALEIALEIDSPIAGTILNNLAVEAFITGDLRRAEALYRDSIQVSERLGDREGKRFTGTNLIYIDFFVGRWDDALPALNEFIAACEAGAPHANEPDMRTLRGSIRRARGESSGARTDHLRAVELARAGDRGHLMASLFGCAAMHAESGELREARALLAEAVSIVRETGKVRALMQIAGFLEQLGFRDALLEAIQMNTPRRATFWQGVELLVLEGDLVGAADVLAETGAIALEATLRRHAGERLVELGRPAEGTVELERALAFYRSVDASAYVARIEATLAGAQSASA